MIGLISLLTDDAYLQVERAQRWLEEKHGFTNPGYARPHVTYVIGEGSAAPPGLIERIEVLAEETAPFQIRLSGLGIFPEEAPVLYLPVQASAELAALQGAACRAFAEAGETIRPYYGSESWIPHVTLASGMVTLERMEAVCAELPAEGTDLMVRLAGLALAEESGEGNWAITQEFPFRGQNELPPNPFGLRSRPCQPSDRDFVYRLVEETLRPLVSAYFEWDPALFDRNWRGSWRQKVMVLVEGRRVGYLQYDATPPAYLYIGGLFLLPAVQGRGWGQWLLRYMEGGADGRPVRLHVWENNPAVAFYQKHGYRIIETEGHRHLMEKKVGARRGEVTSPLPE